MAKPTISDMEFRLHAALVENDQLKSQLKAAADLDDLNSMDTIDLQCVRNAAKRALEQRIIKAYSSVDEQELIKTIEVRLQSEINAISDSLLGIDRRWSEIEIKEGRLRDILNPAINEMLEERAKPLILDLIATFLNQQTFKKIMHQAIKTRLHNAIQDFTRGTSSEVGRTIDKMVQEELQKTLAEFTSPTTYNETLTS